MELKVSAISSLTGNLVVDRDTELEINSFLTVNNQQSLRIPSGPISDRWYNPTVGSLRYNTDISGFELYGGDERWSGDVVDPDSDDTEVAFLTVTGGLVGWYDVDSFIDNQNVWTDKSGNNNDTILSKGNPYIAEVSGFGASRITRAVTFGGPYDGLTWPTSIVPSTFTFIHVARYSGGYTGRIFDGTSPNWLSGFHNGNTAVSYHNGWITASSPDRRGFNWILSVDKNSTYRANKGAVIASGGGGTSKQIAVNMGNYNGSSQPSDCQIVEMLVYDRSLSDDEVLSVENYLDLKYGFTYF